MFHKLNLMQLTLILQLKEMQIHNQMLHNKIINHLQIIMTTKKTSQMLEQVLEVEKDHLCCELKRYKIENSV
jgi:hypothetical protein